MGCLGWVLQWVSFTLRSKRLVRTHWDGCQSTGILVHPTSLSYDHVFHVSVCHHLWTYPSKCPILLLLSQPGTCRNAAHPNAQVRADSKTLMSWWCNVYLGIPRFWIFMFPRRGSAHTKAKTQRDGEQSAKKSSSTLAGNMFDGCFPWMSYHTTAIFRH